MPLNDPMDNRKPYPGAVEFRFGMQPFERLEHLSGPGGFKSNAVVFKAEAVSGRTIVFFLTCKEFYLCPGSFRGELPGIPDEVREHDGHEAGIGAHDKVSARNKLDFPAGLQFLQFGYHGGGELAEVNDLHGHRRIGKIVEFQETFYDQIHFKRIPGNVHQKVAEVPVDIPGRTDG